MFGLWIFGGMTSLTEVLQWRDTDSLGRMGRQSEGVVLYVREQLEYMELCVGMGKEPLESLWIRIKGRTGKNVSFIMGACYRPLDQEAL